VSPDLFNPPTCELGSAGLARGRANLIEEIERERSSDGLYGRARQRPLLVFAAVVVAALIPLSALAVTGQKPFSQWWFLRFHSLAPSTPYPAKGTGVDVVETGSWDGHAWVLTAFRSTTGSICVELTATANGKGREAGGSGTCGAVQGVPSSATSTRPKAVPIIAAVSSAGLGFPNYSDGAVTGKISKLAIHFADGTVLRTPTFVAPSSVGAVRLFATRLPGIACPPGAPPAAPRSRLRARVTKFVGLDQHGKIVAALRFPAPPSGVPRPPQCPRNSGFSNPLGRPVPGAASHHLETASRVTGPFGGLAILRVASNVTPPCWRIDFSVGRSQAGCQSPYATGPWVYVLGVQPAGRDVFIVGQTRAPVVRVSLQFGNGDSISARPTGRVVVFAVPRGHLSANRQRAHLIGYDDHGRKVQRTAAYFRVRPSGRDPEPQ